MKFDYACVKDPECFQINRLMAHSDHKYYANPEEVCEKQSSFIYSLNGLWKFSFAKNIKKAIAGFEESTFDCKGWDEITVPGHIQLQGYDYPQYTNIMYPWDGHEEIKPGEIPNERNCVGSYVKYFNLPEHFRKERTYISFQGVETAFAVWLNGIFIGYSEDSFTPSEFDLSHAITQGENKLAVQVYQFSSGSWLEDQDFWRFSGIFRDVYLYTIPNIHVRDMFIKTDLSKELDTAQLKISLQFKKESDQKVLIKGVLRDLNIMGDTNLLKKCNKSEINPADS